MFPVSLGGSVRVRPADAHLKVQATAERIADMVDEQAEMRTTVEHGLVRIEHIHLIGTGRSSVLAPFNAGTLWVEVEGDDLRVRYSLSTMRLLLIVTGVLAAVFGTATLWHLAHGGDWRKYAEIFAVGWLWLFGMNYLTAAIRVPRWLKRGLS